MVRNKFQFKIHLEIISIFSYLKTSSKNIFKKYKKPRFNLVRFSTEKSRLFMHFSVRRFQLSEH